MDYHKRVDRLCVECGETRSIIPRKGIVPERCQRCAARVWQRDHPDAHPSRESHPRWRGGIHSQSNGYRSVVVPLDSPYLAMADERGRVYEHRLVVAQSLGRCLDTSEEVHHRNEDKHDNRLSNLRLLSKSEHAAAHHAELERLRAEVRSLRDELRQARSS